MADIIDFKTRKIEKEENEVFEPPLDWETWIDDKVEAQDEAIKQLQVWCENMSSYQKELLCALMDLSTEVGEARSILNSLIRGLNSKKT